MSDTGTPAGGAPAAPATGTPAPSTDATPAPAGPRRRAPGLTTDGGAGISLTDGMRSLRRAAAAPAAPAAATEGTPAAPGPLADPAAPPRRRTAPSQPAPPPTHTATPPQAHTATPTPATPQQTNGGGAAPNLPPSALDKIMESFLPGAAAAATDADQQQQPQPQPAPVNTYLQGVPLTIGGQQRTYAMAELTDLVSKGADYTNKTQALAENARQLNERQQTIDQLLPILVPEIERQLQALNGADPPPDWVALANSTDQGEYNRQHAAWLVRQQARDAERERLSTLTAANQQQQEQQRQQRMRVSHAQLVRTLPGWGDQTTRTALIGEMRTWGLQNGYPAAELDSVVEARHIETIAKAMMFDRIMLGARTMAPTVPAVRRGGAPTPPAPAALRTAQDTFNANPNRNTGVQLYLAQRAGRARSVR